ncbi:benzoate/H(+) symporter BenE family transporter [Streptomyces sp. NPDC000070]|uniref:benzoate/H(+) symporter BenE family transporter n=1 Tax=Streptomyces sp. NPDC000070 TaxID=3154240 RepID=UPI00333008B7
MRSSARRILRIAPVSAVTAGLIAVLVGVTSSAAIVFTAAQAVGAGDEELASWMLALGIGMGVTSVGLSLRYRAPVVTAWSTPGAALLATGLEGMSTAQAIGAFLIFAALITLSGVTGWFTRVMDRVPVPLTAGLLAGVLVQFGTGLFTAMDGSFALVFSMFAVYLLCRRLIPRYAVIAALTARSAGRWPSRSPKASWGVAGAVPQLPRRLVLPAYNSRSHAGSPSAVRAGAPECARPIPRTPRPARLARPGPWQRGRGGRACGARCRGQARPDEVGDVSRPTRSPCPGPRGSRRTAAVAPRPSECTDTLGRDVVGHDRAAELPGQLADVLHQGPGDDAAQCSTCRAVCPPAPF